MISKNNVLIIRGEKGRSIYDKIRNAPVVPYEKLKKRAAKDRKRIQMEAKKSKCPI